VKAVVEVPETVPERGVDVCHRSVELEPVSGLGEMLQAWDLSHQYVAAVEVRVGVSETPNWVQLRPGAGGVPPPLTE
jgi:hypothetical protein